MAERLQINNQEWWFVNGMVVCKDRVTGSTKSTRIVHPSFESLKDLAVQDIQLAPSNDAILVLLDPARPGYRTAGNLVRISLEGDIEWWVELADTGWDNYVKVDVSNGQITAFSWSGYSCRIDAQTGRIIERQFVK